jgi:hypothetical protein
MIIEAQEIWKLAGLVLAGMVVEAIAFWWIGRKW